MIQPVSVFRGVMHRKPVPDSSATFDAIVVGERLAAVDVQVVHHQMDGGNRRVVFHEITDHLSELARRAAAFRRLPGRLPFWQCTHDRVPPRTTFFPRHGLKSWWSNKIRMDSRPMSGTSLRFTASSATSRTVHRAHPSGGSLQTIAMIRCFWLASNVTVAPGCCLSCSARSRPYSS